MERPDCSWGSDDKGEEEAGAEPVYYAGGCGEELGGCVGDCGVGKPLFVISALAIGLM